MTRFYLSRAFARVESSARTIISDVAEGDMLRAQMAILRRLAKREPYNTIALGQQIAAQILERGKYSLS